MILIILRQIIEVNKHIENKKRNLRSIIKIDDIEEQNYNNGYELLDSEAMNIVVDYLVHLHMMMLKKFIQKQ